MIRIAITTYNRHAMLARLIEHLDADDVDIVVYDDGSEPPVESDVATVYRYDQNAGKAYWYLRVRDLFRDALLYPEWDYFVWLADDLEPLYPDSVRRMVDLFEAVRERDPRAICLNPVRLRHHPMSSWGSPEPVKVEGLPVYRVDWMDCGGIVDRRFVELAGRALARHLPAFLRDIGTRVGRAITHASMAEGYSMYMVEETIFGHGNHPSRLTPEGRKDVLVT